MYSQVVDHVSTVSCTSAACYVHAASACTSPAVPCPPPSRPCVASDPHDSPAPASSAFSHGSCATTTSQERTPTSRPSSTHNRRSRSLSLTNIPRLFQDFPRPPQHFQGLLYSPVLLLLLLLLLSAFIKRTFADATNALMFDIHTQKPVTLYIYSKAPICTALYNKQGNGVRIGRQTDRQTDRQRDWYTDRQADWQTGGGRQVNNQYTYGKHQIQSVQV